MAKNNKPEIRKPEPKPKDAPETLKNSGFFRRLSFKLSDEQKEFRDAIYNKENKIVFVNAKAGSGKAQPKDLIIPTPTGLRRFGDLRVGDYVFDRDGLPTRILGVYDQGLQEAYEIVFGDDRKTICCGEHLWTYYSNTERGYESTMTLNSLLKRNLLMAQGGKTTRYSIPLCKPVQYEHKEYKVDPYVIGLFLGDGCCLEKYLAFSSATEETVDSICRLCGFKSKKYSDCNYTWYFEDGAGRLIRTKDFFKNLPTLIQESGNKSIPEEYLYGSIEQRFALLQGLMDTDGGITYACSRYNLRYTTTSAKLKDDLLMLVRSLGYAATVNEDNRSKYKSGICYNIYMCVPQTDKYKFFRLSTKQKIALEAKKTDGKHKYDRISIKSITKLSEPKDMMCIYVDNPDHLYLTNDYIVTHNTTVAIATACAMVEYGLYDEILYCFSLNNNFQSILGLLPGGIEDKERAFYEPCIEAVVECGYFPDRVIKELSEKGDGFISCKSHTFLRGTNIGDRSILIIDEAQNFYADELKKVLTRVKDGAKVIVIGHDGQCDLIKNRNHSGFIPYIKWFKGRSGVAICELTENHRGWVSRIADEFDINKIFEGEKNAEENSNDNVIIDGNTENEGS